MTADDTYRIVALVEVVTLIACGTGFHIAYRDCIPRTPWRAGWAYGYVLAIVAAALAVNLVSGAPMTTGAQVLTIALLPAVVFILVIFGDALRAGLIGDNEPRGAIVRNADEVAVLVEHVGHLEPCANPDCQRVRGEMQSLLHKP